MAQDFSWYINLQEIVKQTVLETYQGNWIDDPIADQALYAEIKNRAGSVTHKRGWALTIKPAGFTKQDGELKIYATVSENCTKLRDIQETVHLVLTLVHQDYFMMIPSSTPEELHYWFLIGCKPHIHIGRIIIPVNYFQKTLN